MGAAGTHGQWDHVEGLTCACESVRAAARPRCLVACHCLGCGQNRLRKESDGHACTAHLRRPKPPPLQGVGALAAPERDDRAATPERVPHRLPAAEVTACGVTCKPAMPVFTHCAPTTRCDWRQRPRYRISAPAISHVTADQATLIQAPPCKAMLPSFTRWRPQMGWLRSCHPSHRR